jgi:Ring finger domain
MGYLGELPGLVWDQEKEKYFSRVQSDVIRVAVNDELLDEEKKVDVRSVPVDERVVELLIKESKMIHGECGVCSEHGKLNIQLNCGHSFHDACLIPWVKIKGSCPICRGAVDTALNIANIHSHR